MFVRKDVSKDVDPQVRQDQVLLFVWVARVRRANSGDVDRVPASTHQPTPVATASENPAAPADVAEHADPLLTGDVGKPEDPSWTHRNLGSPQD
jgi:hypothetical protein